MILSVIPTLVESCFIKLFTVLKLLYNSTCLSLKLLIQKLISSGAELPSSQQRVQLLAYNVIENGISQKSRMIVGYMTV